MAQEPLTSFWDIWSDNPAENQRKWTRISTPELGPSGDGWKRTATANPDILKVGDRLLLYYRGTGAGNGEESEPGPHNHFENSSSLADFDQIGVAFLGRNGRGLEELPTNPVVPSGGPDSWKSDVLDPAAVLFEDEILLYFSALGPEGDSIGLARSQDGVSFSLAERVMAGRSPAAVVRGGNVLLFSQEHLQEGGYGIFLYESKNGLQFQQITATPVFAPQPGAWDSYSVVTMRIFEDGDGYMALYGGSASKLDEPDGFGLARSRDLCIWERHPGNPIFTPGPAGSPDEHTLWFPALVRTEEGWLMLYEGGRLEQGELVGTLCCARV